MKRGLYNDLFNFEKILNMDIGRCQKLKLLNLDKDLLESCMLIEKESLKSSRMLLLCGLSTLLLIALLNFISKDEMNVITVISISTVTCTCYSVISQINESKVEIRSLQTRLNILKKAIELEKKKED